MKRAMKSLNLWIALLLLLANGAAWAYALAPGEAAVHVEPRLEPDIAALRTRLAEGGHSGEPFYLDVTDQEAAEMLAWYLDRHPDVPFRDPQVSIRPDGIGAQGVAQVAGLRVSLSGRARIELVAGGLAVTVGELRVAGVGVPGFVRSRIQDELDAQIGLFQNLPVIVDDLRLEAGHVVASGTIR